MYRTTAIKAINDNVVEGKFSLLLSEVSVKDFLEFLKKYPKTTTEYQYPNEKVKVDTDMASALVDFMTEEVVQTDDLTKFLLNSKKWVMSSPEGVEVSTRESEYDDCIDFTISYHVEDAAPF